MDCKTEEEINTFFEKGDQTMNCVVENKSALPFTGTIILPITKSPFLESIDAINEQQVSLPISTLGTKLVIKNIHFDSFEKHSISLHLVTNNNYVFYSEQIKELLSQLSNETDSALIAQGNELLIQENSSDFIKNAIQFISTAKKSILLKKQALEKENTLHFLKETLQEKILHVENYLESLKELGIEEEQTGIISIITTSTAALESLDQKQMEKAIQNLSKITFDTNSALEEHITYVIKTRKDKVGTNKELKLLLTKMEQEKIKFQRYAQITPTFAKEAIDTLNQIASEFDTLLLGLTDTTELELIQSLKNYCTALIQKIRSELSYDEAKLVAAKLIKPITLSRLDSLETKLGGVLLSDKTASEKKSELQQIQNELQTALDILKKQTIESYNEAIDAKKENTLLTNAKKYIDSNKYVAAFLLLRTPEKQAPEIPFLYFIPLVCILLVGIMVKREMSKKKTSETTNKELIENSWKD